MKIVKNPDPSLLAEILTRPRIDISKINNTVEKILNDIKQTGDDAVIHYEKMFDRVTLHSLIVTDEEIEKANSLISNELENAISIAHSNIKKFHESQKNKIKKIETISGVTCWQKSIPIQKVGLYIPGGTAPLFSTVLMLATPAKIAGCNEIVLCSPPDKDGNINPAILVAAKIAGVNKIFKTGGVQAIGAMAYGTKSIPKVYKIFGPGNQYVMTAKQQVSIHDVAIDMPAGPSEVCIITDETGNPEFIAADLLSQAEHGMDSQVILISSSEEIVHNVQKEINIQIKALPRYDIASKALENSVAIIVNDNNEAINISNIYAPEHLIITTKDYEDLAEKVINAGSVFLGKYACESAGDYASGTNHTLPTHGYATAYNGVNLDSYIRKVTFQHLTKEGVNSIGHTVEILAENEQLTGHKNAMTVRLRTLSNKKNETIR